MCVHLVLITQNIVLLEHISLFSKKHDDMERPLSIVCRPPKYLI